MKPQLNVARPCSESWGAMTPVEGARLCARCDRRVIDFRDATDEEIARAHRESDTRICGAYSTEQHARWSGSLPILLPLALGATLLGGDAAAQQIPTPVAHDSAAARAGAPDAEEFATVAGTVRDSTGNPLSGVSIYIAGTSLRTVSDSVGRYTIRVRRPIRYAPRPRIQFARIGFQLVEASPELEPGVARPLDVVLHAARIQLEGIVVTAHAPRSIWGRIRDALGRIF
jgi:hypothetical protein